MTSRTAVAISALALAAICVVVVLTRMPRHGLVLQRFNDPSFQVPLDGPVVDGRIHFSTEEKDRPAPDWVKPHSWARWTGYIDIPRGAEYTLGLVSDDGGLLYVDDALVVDNGGSHPRRNKDKTLRLDAGYHAIRIDYSQADGDATMKFAWHRSGNNPTYEIVPTSMLYPERPPPISTSDRALRLAPWVLIVLAAWVLRARAFPLNAHAPRTYGAAAFVFLTALGARLNGLLSEGETCDQWTYVSAGYVYAQNIAAGIIDADQWAWNSEHPNIGKLVYGVVQFVFGTETWKSNATAAFLGAFTVLATFWAGVRLAGLATGIGAALILALLPSFVAHGRVAALDAPSTLFFTLSMALLIRAMRDERGPGWSFGAMTLTTGLAIGTKFSNVFLLPLQGIAILWLYWPILRQKRWPKLPWILYAFPILILVPTIATWPWMWTSPAAHWEATHSHWQFAPADVFLGEIGPPPAAYFFVAFLSVVPVALFPFFLTALAQPLRRSPALLSRGWWLFLLAWFAIPFAWTLVGFRMNGVRYILNVFPPFSLLAGLGLIIVGTSLSSRMRIALPLLTAAATGYLLFVDARIHPYYLDYFNEAVGGTKSVQERRFLDTGWWGEGIDSAVAWVNANAAPGATYTVQAWSPPGVLSFRPDLRRDDGRPNFIVRQMQPITASAPYAQVFEITAGGAPIVRVFQRQ